MDATTIAIIGAIATVLTVVISHWLSQKQGEKRANHVRDEVLSKIASLESRVTEVKTDFNGRIAELRADDASHASQLRAEMNGTVSRVETRLEGMKEAFALELRAVKAEILGVLAQRAQRVRRVGSSYNEGEEEEERTDQP